MRSQSVEEPQLSVYGTAPKDFTPFRLENENYSP